LIQTQVHSKHNSYFMSVGKLLVCKLCGD